ncbi:MAG: hypothetical protein CMJ19_12295 [Phycisphaeraceae bacterium]|nr:hypothetical protein [Phycisphaeraceae bacterium]
MTTAVASSASTITLRPYQAEAVAAVYDHLRTRDDNPCVVIPTAGGKTPVMASICRDAVTQWDGRVLILAHVKELLEQAVDVPPGWSGRRESPGHVRQDRLRGRG